MTMVGVIGNAADKFTAATERKAKALIRGILTFSEIDPTLVSGHCHLGGIDIWAEEMADGLGLPKIIHVPTTLQWDPPGYGYKARNLDIARSSDQVHVIVAESHPPDYTGRKFDTCYHCARADRPSNHVKSGACWTLNQALEMGKLGWVHVVREEESPE